MAVLIDRNSLAEAMKEHSRAIARWILGLDRLKEF